MPERVAHSLTDREKMKKFSRRSNEKGKRKKKEKQGEGGGERERGRGGVRRQKKDKAVTCSAA